MKYAKFAGRCFGLGLAWMVLLANPLGAQNNTYPWPQTGNVGIGTATPAYKLDIPYTSGTALRIGGYGTLTSVNAYHLAVHAGADYSSGAGWIARSTVASGIHAYEGNLHLIANTGLTVGSGFGHATRMFIRGADGYVGIGTANPQYNLAVNGVIGAKDVMVTSQGWPDYVFKPGYRLRPLSEVNAFIQANRHLPDIPSEAEVKEKGVSVGEMQAKLLAKIEEMTLHLIRQEKENGALRERLAALESRSAGR